MHYPYEQPSIATSLANLRPLLGLLSLAWPTMLTHAGFGLRAFMDVTLVGRIDTYHLAAIMPAQYVLLVFQVFGMGMFFAINPIVARQLKRGKPSEAGSVTWNGIWLALIVGLALTAATFATDLFAFLGHEDQVQALEIAYFRIAILSLPIFFVVQALVNFFCAVESPRVAMWSSAVYVILGLILNIVLIPPFGIEGAAWSLVGSTAAWVLFLVIQFRFSSVGKTYRGSPRLQSNWLHQLAGKGVFFGGADIADLVFWNVALVALIGRFGTDHLAAAALVISVNDLIIIFAEGIGVAIATRVSSAAAMDHKEEVERNVWIGAKANLLFMVPLALLSLLVAVPLFGMMGALGPVLEIAKSTVVWLPILLGLEALLMTFNNALGGLEDAAWPFGAFLVSNLVFILGLGYGLSLLFPSSGPHLIWACIALNRAAIVTALFCRWKQQVAKI